MNRIILMIVLVCFNFLPVFSQPGNETKTKTEEKFYLPIAVLDDPAALAKAIPGIAEQALATIPKNGTPYFKQAHSYYLLTGEYQKAADAIDSVRKAENDPSWRMPFKVYTQAKLQDNSEGEKFKQLFKKEFSASYTKLSFEEKVDAAWVDSLYISELNKDYKNWIEDLKKSKSDSISLEDAKQFSMFYRDYLVFNKIWKLTLPYISDPKYKTTFPAIKSNKWGGVIPVDGIDELPDPKMKYKFVMELTSFGMPKEADSVTSKDMNLALRDVSRTINLHVANGIPKENIDIVLAVHGKALNAFLTNEKYKKKYAVDNPNLPILKELQDFGVKIIMCGQAMHYLGIKRESFIPGVKVALTAQTVISYYQLKNYVFSDLVLQE